MRVRPPGAPEEGAAPAEITYELEVLRFPYVGSAENYFLDAPDLIARAVDASTLTIVDPSWDETVPEEWRRRMRGTRSPGQ